MHKEDYYKKQENAEEICKRILTEADSQAEMILERARQEAALILDRARKDAEIKKDGIFKESQGRIEKLKEKITSSISFEKRKTILREKDAFLRRIFESVNELALNYRNAQGYSHFLKKIIVKGAEIIGTSEIDIFYSFLDEKIISDDLKREITQACRERLNGEYDLRFQSAEFQDIGVLMKSRDGRVVCDRRFQSLFETIREEAYMRLLKEVF